MNSWFCCKKFISHQALPLKCPVLLLVLLVLRLTRGKEAGDAPHGSHDSSFRQSWAKLRLDRDLDLLVDHRSKIGRLYIDYIDCSNLFYLGFRIYIYIIVYYIYDLYLKIWIYHYYLDEVIAVLHPVGCNNQAPHQPTCHAGINITFPIYTCSWTYCGCDFNFIRVINLSSAALQIQHRLDMATAGGRQPSIMRMASQKEHHDNSLL